MSGTTSSLRRPQRMTHDELLVALDQRLTAAAEVLVAPEHRDHPPLAPGELSARHLPHLVSACLEPGSHDARWLVLTAVFGAFPTPEQVLEFGRTVELSAPGRAEASLLARAIRRHRRVRLDLPIRIVTDAVVVEVDRCARVRNHTGIQRTVRETLPRWNAAHDIIGVAWAENFCAFRTLNPRGKHLVFSFGEEYGGTRADEAAYRPELVVPWKSSVVLPDVFNVESEDQLTALARFSGNTVSVVGYDLIPMTIPETRPRGGANGTAAFLSMLKYTHRVAGISRSAVAEFSGFTQALRAQGLTGPEVHEVRLVGESLRGAAPPRARERDRPVMLLLGRHEPHKNQRAALHAAERLWREGLDFEVRLVGAPGWSNAVLKPAIDALVKARRPIRDLGRVSDAELLAEMTSADFAYFASLHEGFGLSVAEALVCGTPVITSNFGSQAEIAELGGCLMVDPRDDDDITSAIRTLLTDEVALQRLRDEAASLPVRTWDDYAADLWDFVAPRKDNP